MKIVLRRMELMGELSVAADEVIDVERLFIGRGTDQHLELPDMRLSLEHSEIRELRAGEFLLESRTLTGAWVNGVPAPSHRIQVGDVIDCGRFRIAVGPPPPGADLLLEVVERESVSDEKAKRRKHFRINLPEGGLRMRSPAWILAGLLLLATLLLPVAFRYLLPVTLPGLALDRIWESGPRSSAHSRFLTDCAACHQQPFRQVENGACLGCHTGVAGHSDQPEINAIAGMGDARCGACHFEHSGRPALRASAPGTCVDCHDGPEPRFASAQMPSAGTFHGEHPPFSPEVPRYMPEDGFRFEEPIQQAGIPILEDSNLTFPHDAHLDPKGLRTPDGTRVLACADCHSPKGGGAGFLPIRMTEHCAGCHRLDFDSTDPDRLLPHGQAADVARVIRDHYARQALAGDRQDPAAPEIVRMRRVPGEALKPEQRRAALDWADAQAARAIADVFDRRICGSCHVVERTGDPALPYRIAPVFLSSTYLTGARFNHAAHRTEACSSCHKAATSSESRTLMLPDIQSCRSCHADPGQSSKVPSECSDCHTFHSARNTRMGVVRETRP